MTICISERLLPVSAPLSYLSYFALLNQEVFPMARRRLYVFGTIIVVGLLIGIFCLPDGGEQSVPAEEGGPRKVAQGPAEGPQGLPGLVIENTAATKAEKFVGQARLENSIPARHKLLIEAYKADKRGRWGGQAAAEIGDIHKRRNNTEQARQWYTIASHASLSAETAARMKAELVAAAPVDRAPALTRVKFLTYRVQPGDSLWKIARRYATSIGAIKQANKLTRSMIRVGKTLRVPKGPFDALVSKSKHTLQLLQDGKPVKVYRVGLGRDNGTPVGSFLVSSKLVNPVWYSESGRIPYGDPRNVLGSRWIGFSGRIGIHGTRKSEESTIGKDLSDGCIRMLDRDVQELYGFLVEGKSKITVVE